jgi:phosphatidate cytidylyltransferase
LSFSPPLAALSIAAKTNILFGVVLGVLAACYVVSRLLRKQPEGTVNPAIVRTFHHRIGAWWLMYAILIASFQLGFYATLFLFGGISFWALREFITMTPTRRGDHRALFWVFFIITPGQYILVGLGQSFYHFFSIAIPVYASLLIPARIAVSGDPKRFLERSAKIQFGLLICVYALSYAPALLTLPLKQPAGATRAATVQSSVDGTTDAKSPDGNENGATSSQTAAAPAAKRAIAASGNHGLLFYFILMVQLSEVLQFAWGKLLGQNVIAPSINGSRTWEGFIGGVVSTALLGILFSWVTPFGVWEAACMSAVIAVMGFAGGMTMSAIKRDRGVTDYGTLVEGHAGVLDRLDSICFAAPVFYHLTRQFFT